MSYKTIIAYARCEAEMKRILMAVRLVTQKVIDAHVIGLYSVPSPVVYADPNGFIDPSMFEMHDKHHQENAQRLKLIFETDMRLHGTSFDYRVVRSNTGSAADGVLESAFGADLVIAGQPDPNDADAADDTTDTLVFNSGRPVLMVPFHFNASTHSLERIAIAFNDKREGARAAFDSLPLLKTASRTDVIWIDPPETENDTPALGSSGLAAALRRHGVNVNKRAVGSHGQSVQDTMREYIVAERIDVLVMGAYSHSKLRELVFGGVTRSILTDMPILTLLSR